MIILHEIAAASAVTPSAAAKKTLFINTADGRPWLKDSFGVSTPLDGNTVLYGTAAPTTEGVDGNFYIRTTTSFIYGPKAGGVWPAGISLVGPGFLAPTGTGLVSVASGVLDAASKPIGVASATDILDRQSGDARFAAATHAHSASDITSGTIDQARLGTGSGGAGTKVLYDDQTFKTLPASGATNMWIGAAEFIPRTTNGCGINSAETTTNKVNYDVLEFDAAAIEYAQASRIMPSNWALGTVTAKVHWTAASGSGDVIFAVQARSFANDDPLDAAFGTAQTTTDTLTAVGDLDITPATAAITIAGTPAAGQLVIFQLYRNATDSGDTLAVDAQVLGIEISF